jgi:hypothetical protein
MIKFYKESETRYMFLDAKILNMAAEDADEIAIMEAES